METPKGRDAKAIKESFCKLKLLLEQDLIFTGIICGRLFEKLMPSLDFTQMLLTSPQLTIKLHGMATVGDVHQGNGGGINKILITS